MNHFDALINWASLRVAIGDELDDAPRLSKKHLEQVLSKLLKKRIVVEDDEAWRLSIRAALIESVLAQLGSQRATRDGRMYDRTQQTLTEHQREQAGLFEARSADIAKATTPSQIQRLLIEHLSGTVAKGSLSSNDQKWVNDLPHRMVAIEYLATNNLQETVMLQQIWVRLLKTSMLQVKPGRSSEGEKILAELQKKNRQAKSALRQLRNGQLAIVKIWKVWNRPMNQ